ncbi:MAG: helix-hairpin-helix domain-containing protein [Dehalococcoidia bacterium]
MRKGVVVPVWWRQPQWWPVLALGVALAVGLLLLAARPDGTSGSVAFYAPQDRPSPIPLDRDTNRLVDLNRASPAELEALPRIGAVRAQAIVELRAERPFRSLADAVERGALPRSVAEGLLGLAEARP